MVENIKLKNQTLKMVSGELLPNIPNRNETLNINVKHYVRWETTGGNLLTIDLDTVVGPTPSALFLIKLNHSLTFGFNGEIDVEELMQNMSTVCPSLGNQISYLVSTISHGLIGTYIIIPPHLNREGIQLLNT